MFFFLRNLKSVFLFTVGFRAQTARRRFDVFLNGDLEEFQSEKPGVKPIAEFYDYFPDLEYSAKEFTLRRCSEKAADFTATVLANVIDQQYYLTTHTMKGVSYLSFHHVS